jgi:hypothetical protein
MGVTDVKVPVPGFDARVYDLRNEKVRYFLTGGLPKPSIKRDGAILCPYCATNVPAVAVDTHVKGAWPVRSATKHRCR